MLEGIAEIIVVDTNVIIKLIQNNQFYILGNIPGVQFVVPDEVINEITYLDQRIQVLKAISEKRLWQISISDSAELILFIEIGKRVDPGEAACLAISQHRGYSILSDEKRRFEKEAIARVGKHRLLRTDDILVKAKQNNLLP